MIRKLLNNAFSNVAIIFIKLAIAFVMSPIIVRALGNHDYGIWEIVFSVIGYMGLMEIGLQPAIVRFVARLNALNDKKQLDKIFSTTLFFMGTVGFIGSLLLVGWALALPYTQSNAGPFELKYTYFLLIVAIQLWVTFIGHVFQSFHHGYQRYSLTNIITALNSLIGAVILFFLLQRGYGFLTLTIANAIGVILKFAVFGILLRSTAFGGFVFRLKNVSMSTFKELVSFGLKSFVLGISSRISSSTGLIIIGWVLGPVAVTYFAIPMNLVKNARNVLMSITLGFMPFFSELHARHDNKVVRDAFLISSRYVVAIAMLFLLGITTLGYPFIARWMGLEYAEKGKVVMLIIAFAYMLPLLNPFHGRLLTSAGRHGILAKIRFVESVCNCVLSLILIFLFKKEGIAIALLIPALIFEPVILVYVCKYLKIGIKEFAKQVLIPQVIPCILFFLFFFVLNDNLEINSYLTILFAAISMTMIYTASLLMFFIPTDEKKYILFQLRSKLTARKAI